MRRNMSGNLGLYKYLCPGSVLGNKVDVCRFSIILSSPEGIHRSNYSLHKTAKSAGNIHKRRFATLTDPVSTRYH